MTARAQRQRGHVPLRGLAWLAAAVALLLVLLVAAVALLGRTQGGTQFVWRAVQPYLPYGVSVERVDGELLRRLELSGIRIEQEALALTLAHAAVEWRPGELLGGVLDVRSISLRDLDYTALPAEQPAQEEPSEPPSLPDALTLPVAIKLGEFLLEDASVRASADAEPFVVDALRFGATLVDNAWELTGLAGSGPLFALEGGATLEPGARYSNEFRIDWTLRPPELAALTGTTTLSGDLEQVALSLQVAAPYQLDASAVVTDPLGRLTLEADAVLDTLQLQAVRDDLPALALSVQAQASGAPTDLGVTLRIRGTGAAIGTGQLDLAARYAGNAIAVERLLLTSPDTPGRLQGGGTIALGADATVDMRVDWQGLQWPLAGAADYSSPAGEATVTGTPGDYRVDSVLDWNVRLDQPQSGRLSVTGRGNTESFELEQLALTGAAGTMTGAGSVAWAPALDITARLQGNAFNPGAFAPQWPGAIDFSLAGWARQQDDGLHAGLDELQAQGSLREQPLRIQARAAHDPRGTSIEQLMATSGATRLRATGTVADSLDIVFNLDSDDLGTTLPGAAGVVRASGRATGPLRRPRIVAKLDARDLVYGGYLLAGANLDADVDASGAHSSRVALQLSNGQAGAIQLGALALNGDGTPGSHALDLRVDSSLGRLEVAASGALPDALDDWRFRLQSALVQYAPFDAWRLDTPVAGVASGARQQLERACFTSGAARACLQGENNGAGANGEFSVQDLPYEYLRPLLPATVQLDGSVAAEGSVSAPTGGALDGALALRTSAGAVRTTVAEGDAVTLLAMQPGRIDARMAGGAVDLTLDLPLVGGGGLQGEVVVAAGDVPLAERPLSGELDLAIDNLEVVRELVAEVDALDGRVRGQMSLGGSLGAPELTGTANLAAARLHLATPGLEISDVALGLTGRGETLDVRLSARSGEGTLDVDGALGLGAAGWRADLAVKGDAFQVIGTREARLWASPDLQVRLSAQRVDVSGSLAVPRGEITPQSLPATGAVTVSDDQVILLPGSDEAVRQAGPQVHANLRVIIGDPNLRATELAERGRNFDDILRRLPGNKVVLDGFGLRAVLAGELLVTQTPHGPATGSGELRVVVGEYKAYGQDLTIRDGRILFSGGPVTQPAINISAYRQPQENILVGVRVRGTLEQPRLGVYSEPANMTQSEQLSWLVLGRPLSGASSSETSLVTQAALALGLKGGNMVTGNIRDKIGLDEFGLESAETTTGAEQAALVIGKYLTPKLYVSYGIGLFEPVSTVRMRYMLTERWHLETQSTGTESGGDIIYTIERGEQ